MEGMRAGNMKAAGAQVIKVMARDLLQGLKGKPIGNFYDSLCSNFPLIEIKNDAQYRVAIEIVSRLIDKLNSPPSQLKKFVPEIEIYLSTLSALVERYEKNQFPEVGQAQASEVLAYLMESHQLQQGDLAKELGGQSIVSSILNGKRELNLRQIKALAKRFNLSPAAFID